MSLRLYEHVEVADPDGDHVYVLAYGGGLDRRATAAPRAVTWLPRRDLLVQWRDATWHGTPQKAIDVNEVRAAAADVVRARARAA